MKIGHVFIGVRPDKKALKCLLPKHYCGGKKHRHNYFQYYIRWFNIYWCKPRKCDDCGRYLDDAGGRGYNIWNEADNQVVSTLCAECRDNQKNKGIIRGDRLVLREGK